MGNANVSYTDSKNYLTTLCFASQKFFNVCTKYNDVLLNRTVTPETYGTTADGV